MNWKCVRHQLSTMAKIFTIHLNTNFRNYPFELITHQPFLLFIHTISPLFYCVCKTRIVTSCVLMLQICMVVYQKASVGVHFILLYLLKKKSKTKRRNKVPHEKKKQKRKKKEIPKIELFCCIVLISIKGWRRIIKVVSGIA